MGMNLQHYYNQLELIFSSIDFKKIPQKVSYSKLIPIIRSADLLKFIYDELLNELPDFHFDMTFQQIIRHNTLDQTESKLLVEHIEEAEMQSLQSKYLVDFNKRFGLYSYNYFVQYSAFNERIKSEKLDIFNLLIKYFDWRNFDNWTDSEFDIKLLKHNLNEKFYNLDKKVSETFRSILNGVKEAEILLAYWKRKEDSNKHSTSKLHENEVRSDLEIPNPVFMALIQKYFLDGDQPLYNTFDMTRPQKAAFIHFLRDKKTSAKSILSNHLGRPKLSKSNREKFDEIIRTINTTTESNILELFNKKDKTK